MLRKIFFSLLIISFYFCHLSAIELNKAFDMRQLKGKRVGYYTGSFDPIHLGHQHLIISALTNDHVDYVLVYPVPGGDKLKSRLDFKTRLEMIATIFKDHPQVLYTKWTPKQIQDRFAKYRNTIEIVGIIGSDVVDRLIADDATIEKYREACMPGRKLKPKHYNDTTGAITALKPDAFIVGLREKVAFGRTIGDRPIKAFIASSNLSSSEVRKAVSAHLPFKHMLDEKVETFICQQHLYQKRENKVQ